MRGDHPQSPEVTEFLRKVDAMTKRKKLSRAEAEAVLAEYPDADLSAFDVEGGDVEALAIKAANRTMDRIKAKLMKPRRPR